MPQQQLNDALKRLVHAELILRRGTPPDAEYTFKHALVQDAAYGTLLRNRRQQLHARIATILEGQFQEIAATQPTRLAQHCAEAGLTEKAIGYWLAAGRQANARSMTAEAVSTLNRGLALIPDLGDDVLRLHLELHLQIALGRALMVNRGYTALAVGQTYDRARQLCEQLNRPPELWRVLYGLYAYHIMRGEMRLARQLAEEMQGLGQTEGNVPAHNRGWQALEYVTSYKYAPVCGSVQIRPGPAQTSAQTSDVFITDPPYADAINYHEITEYFIAWLRKNPPPPFDQWSWDSRRDLAIKGRDEDFRREMVAAYSAMTKCMPDSGLQAVMFTHQDAGVWADLKISGGDAGQLGD
jgi:hypothetical protein